VFTKRIFGSMNILYDKIKLLSQQHGHRLREVNVGMYDEEDEELLGLTGRRWSRRSRARRMLSQGEGAANSSGLDVCGLNMTSFR